MKIFTELQMIKINFPKLILIICLLNLSNLIATAQDLQDLPALPKFDVSGFVNYEMIYDTYKSVEARDGEVPMFPFRRNLDSLGNDLNEVGQLQMLSILTRLKLKISSVKVLGADAHAIIEGDFFGNSEDNINTFRLRNAYFNLSWSKTSVLAGLFWHPLFVTDCFPEVVAFGAALPFNPLNRAPQLRVTQNFTPKLSLSGTITMHGPFRSKGPKDAQRNSGMPDTQLQLKYKSDDFLIGGTAGYKLLKPRLETDLGLKTDKTIGSYNLQGFLKADIKNFTLKFQTIYGTNLSSYVMIGGYGAQQDPTLVDDYDYQNLATLSSWGEISTAVKAFNFGLFYGYLESQGASGDFYSLGYEYGQDIAYLSRFSPRVYYNTDNFWIGLEYLITSAEYIEICDEHHKPIVCEDPVSNHRYMMSATYFF